MTISEPHSPAKRVRDWVIAITVAYALAALTDYLLIGFIHTIGL